jgi:Methane oxygenase PmoA
MGRHRRGAFLAAAVSAATLSAWLIAAGDQALKARDERICVVPNEAERRVDVLIDGRPFTSYIWPDTVKKPVLYPLRTAKGAMVTRGFPLDPRPGERVDHPHHVGLWFNYGNVNDVDFWNNSDAVKPADRGKMGTVRHGSIMATAGGSGKGELQTEMDWVMPDGKTILREHTLFVFRGGPGFRSVDRITTLHALGERVVFHDDKEGMLGLRVTRVLEAPSEKPEVFTDASGRVTQVAKMENTGVGGVYLTSEGKKGDAAWGTRGRWCILSGNVGKEPVTIAIFDHPKNPGFPTYWHARGYGLFAANPLGRKVFSNGKEELNFTLSPKESVTFRYRVLILSEIASSERMEAAYQEFVAAYR